MIPPTGAARAGVRGRVGGNVGGNEIPDSGVAYGVSDHNTYVHNISDGSLEYTLSESGSYVKGVALIPSL